MQNSKLSRPTAAVTQWEPGNSVYCWCRLPGGTPLKPPLPYTTIWGYTFPTPLLWVAGIQFDPHRGFSTKPPQLSSHTPRGKCLYRHSTHSTPCSSNSHAAIKDAVRETVPLFGLDSSAHQCKTSLCRYTSRGQHQND